MLLLWVDSDVATEVWLAFFGGCFQGWKVSIILKFFGEETHKSEVVNYVALEIDKFLILQSKFSQNQSNLNSLGASM